MKEDILSIIKELQTKREAAHIVPSHVLASEIINRGCKNPYKTINELCKEGRLHWCRTLNDFAFTIREDESKTSQEDNQAHERRGNI